MGSAYHERVLRLPHPAGLVIGLSLACAAPGPSEPPAEPEPEPEARDPAPAAFVEHEPAMDGWAGAQTLRIEIEGVEVTTEAVPRLAGSKWTFAARVTVRNTSASPIQLPATSRYVVTAKIGVGTRRARAWGAACAVPSEDELLMLEAGQTHEELIPFDDGDAAPGETLEAWIISCGIRASQDPWERHHIAALTLVVADDNTPASFEVVAPE